jgi:syntaxin 5
MDRTSEFLAAASSSARAGVRARAPAAPAAPASRGAFSSACAGVGADLRAATSRLTSLARLVRRRGMLGADAASAEAARLTLAVKEDLAACAQKLDALQGYLAAPPQAGEAAGAGGGGGGGGGGSGASTDAVRASAQGRAHGEAVLSALQGALVAAGADFKGVLQARAAALASAADRRVRLVGAGRDIGTADDGRGGGGDAAIDVGGGGGERRAAAASGSPSSATAPALPAAAGAGAGADPFAPVSQAQLQTSLDAEAAYLDARAGDVQVLERHIADLGALFGRLAGLVAQQGEAVARIEDNAASAAGAVEAATLQLRRAAERADAGAAGAVAMRVTAVVVFALIIYLLFG